MYKVDEKGEQTEHLAFQNFFPNNPNPRVRHPITFKTDFYS